MHSLLGERFKHVRHLHIGGGGVPTRLLQVQSRLFNSSSDSTSRWWPPDAEFFGGVLVDFAFLSSAVEAADRSFLIFVSSIRCHS